MGLLFVTLIYLLIDFFYNVLGMCIPPVECPIWYSTFILNQYLAVLFYYYLCPIIVIIHIFILVILLLLPFLFLFFLYFYFAFILKCKTLS